MRIGNDSMQSSATSMGASFNMNPVYLGHICNYALQLVFTGTPAGTFKLQCSNDPGRPIAPGKIPQSDTVENWTDIAGSSQTVSAAGNITWDVQNAGYTWVRVVYTRSSSTGSVTSARFNVKGV